MKRAWCYCYTCKKKVRPVEDRCPDCKKLLWEAQAEHNDEKLRTTKDSYRMKGGSDGQLPEKEQPRLAE
jgi:hypothetical protein